MSVYEARMARKKVSEEEIDERIETLQHTESTLQAVFRSMSEGVVVHDHDGTILHANPAAERILGIGLEAMQGTKPRAPHWELMRRDGSQLPADEVPSEITRRTGEPCRNVVLRVKRSNGELATLKVNTDPVEPSDSTTSNKPQVVATFTDITADEQVRVALQRSRDRLVCLAQAVPDVVLEVLITDDNTVEILFVSDRVEQLFNLPVEQVMSSPLTIWRNVHPDDRADFPPLSEEFLLRPRPFQRELRYLRDGETRWMRVRSTGAGDTDRGKLIHLLIVDITTERRMSDALFDKERQEGLGVLAAGMAHNFNNMLSVISPNLEIALESAPDDVGQPLRDAHAATSEAAELVDRLLALARRRDQGERRRLDLDALVRDVCEVCRKTLGAEVTVEVESDGAPVWVNAHDSELRQVLVNLAINARHAMEARRDARLRFVVRTDPLYAAVDVIDNGTGFSKDVAKRLGEPFFTTKSVDRGTGLGLASALAVMRDLDGSLKWHSTEREGATFTLSLPLASSAENG
jgi:PAS domain S-box-containing protein